ncbi:hypothetical protein Q9L58_009085 [Maublancomyces gigas]|uniref:PXA domain-containing protein n=1 Tax=Discina gigas TaxID=1032678 RepID=A0ABR3G7X1_9PEZI
MAPARPPMPGYLPPAASPSPPRVVTPPPSTLTAAAGTVDKPTLALIRRVLCSHAPPSTPLEELLPPLTGSPEIDLQVWALLALVVRDFVASWYGTLTNDTELVTEVVRIVGVVVGGVAARVGKIDLSVLLLDELPAVLENHINDFRLAQARTATYLSPNLTHAQIFHNLQPHPALAASPDSERLYLKLVSSGLLAVLLPPGDLESDCERSLLREILGSMVLWNAVDKLSEPGTLYEIITKLLGLLSGGVDQPGEPDREPDPEPEKPETKPSNGSDGRRRRSSTTVSKTTTTAMSEKPPLPAPPPPPPPYPPLLIPPALDTLLTLASRALGLLRTFLASLLHTIHTPVPPPVREKPLLRMSIFRLAATYLRLPSLQPWLIGNLLLLTRPLTTRTNPPGAVLDALLSSVVNTQLSSPSLAAIALRLARDTLFAPPRPQPCPSRVRAAAEDAIVDAIPSVLKTLWFPDGDARKRVRELYLEVWADKEINKYLMYQVLDLVVGRVAPELVEVGPAELRRGRVRMGA